MPRKPMQDIVPPDGRSIRNIPLKEGREPKAMREPQESREIREPRESEPREEREVKVTKRKTAPKPASDMVRIEDDGMVIVRKKMDRLERPEVPVEHDLETIKEVRRQFAAENTTIDLRERPKRGIKRYIALGTVAGVIGLAVLLSTVFHSAAMTVTTKTATAALSHDLSAKRNAGAGELAYQVVSVKETASEAVKANGEKTVNTRATGTIVIYNNYSATPQRLIKNTRFETAEGLVYRISDSVTVPGKKGTTPGSVETTVVADEAGEKYNVGLKDFTIPGFKGDPRYEGFYARSKTPLAGGFAGVQKIVADADRAKAKANMEASLRKALLEKAKAGIAPNAVFFENAYTIDFKQLPETAESASEVVLREEGTISAVVFDAVALGSAAARATGSDPGDGVVIRDLSNVSFTPKGDFRPASSDSISFTLKGPVALDWVYDELALKQALSGKSRSEVSAVLSQFPVIQKADISIRPFWRRSFPNSLGAIEISKAR